MALGKLEYIKNSFNQNFNVCRPALGWKYAFNSMLLDVVPHKIRNRSHFCNRINSNCQKKVMLYLKDNFLDVVNQYNWKKKEHKIGEDCNIWIFWWQGIESAPDIVRTCVESIKLNASKHKVIVLDKNNYLDYVQLPDYILEKFHNGKITITHFSDLLRVELLYTYGGIWMDATLYMTRPLDDYIANKFFYTINFNGDGDGVVKLDRWTSFFLADGKNGNLIGMLRKLFFEYWEREDSLIVYLLIDYFITLMYENNIEVQDIIDAVEIGNVDIFNLMPKLNQKISKTKKFDKDTYIFKLTYKCDFLEMVDGEKTVYGSLIGEKGRFVI